MYVIGASLDDRSKYIATIVNDKGSFVRFVTNPSNGELQFDTEAEAEAAATKDPQGRVPYAHPAQ